MFKLDRMTEAQTSKVKKRRKRLFFRTVILLVLVGALAFALISNWMKDKTVIEVGDQAPNFQLMTTNGDDEETIRLSELEGQGVMLNFWATYCKPCEQEMPFMENLYPEYKEKGIEILAVSVDATELVIDRFVDRYELTFPVFHDKTGEVMRRYNVNRLPATLFIDEHGEVVEMITGGLTLDHLQENLDQIVPQG